MQTQDCYYILYAFLLTSHIRHLVPQQAKETNKVRCRGQNFKDEKEDEGGRRKPNRNKH